MDSHDVLDDDLFGDDGRGVLGEVPLGSPFPSGGHTLTLLLDSLVYCLGLGFLIEDISAVSMRGRRDTHRVTGVTPLLGPTSDSVVRTADGLTATTGALLLGRSEGLGGLVGELVADIGGRRVDETEHSLGAVWSDGTVVKLWGAGVVLDNSLERLRGVD